MPKQTVDPMYPHFKALLKELDLSQRQLADEVGCSGTTLSHVINLGLWPLRKPGELKERMEAALSGHGASAKAIAKALKPARALPEPKTPRARTNAKTNAKEPTPEPPKEEVKMLRAQKLHPGARKHFGLFQEPFGDVRAQEDVYLSKDVRYVREAMKFAAFHDGFLAVVGESGSGKSTLRRDLEARISEDDQLHIITPYTMGMEDAGNSGKGLKSQHIAEAIMAVVAPHKKLSGTDEARFQTLHDTLRGSRRAGYAHCVIIEEAHDLSQRVLKQLKRYLELEDGFQRLLSIILIGQPELASKLSEAATEVREVVQRCEMVELRPLNGNLGEYLAHRFERVGKQLDEVLTEDAVEAIKARLSGPRSRSGASTSLCYPLAVGNLVTAALNLAAHLGAPKVTADIIRKA